MKFNRIAVVDIVNIDEAAKLEITKYSTEPVVFVDTDSQSDEEYISRISDSDGVLGTWRTTINKKILDACPNIKYIGICGTSLANIDVEEIKKRNIILTNVTDYGDEATAEYIFTQLLMLARGFGKYQLKSDPSELNGKTLGIVGLGAVGQQVARLGLGFNMRVLYNSRTRKEDWEKKGLTYQDLNTLLSDSDFISLHVPKNNIILGEPEFQLIKPGTVLVDTCLGIVFHIDEFRSWISKKTNFAIFDYKQELYEQVKDLPNVIGPESGTAGKTIESKTRLSQKVVNNLKNLPQ